jgi:hypothetical protein
MTMRHLKLLVPAKQFAWMITKLEKIAS